MASAKEHGIELAKQAYAEGRIDEFDLETRVGYLESKPDDWTPGSREAVLAHMDRREQIEKENAEADNPWHPLRGDAA